MVTFFATSAAMVLLSFQFWSAHASSIQRLLKKRVLPYEKNCFTYWVGHRVIRKWYSSLQWASLQHSAIILRCVKHDSRYSRELVQVEGQMTASRLYASKPEQYHTALSQCVQWIRETILRLAKWKFLALLKMRLVFLRYAPIRFFVHAVTTRMHCNDY